MKGRATIKSRPVNVIASIGILAFILGSLPIAVLASSSTDFSIEPSSQTVDVGQIFTVDIQVDASTQDVDTIGAYVDFDTNYLKVVDESGNIIEGTADDVIIPGEITTTNLTTKLKNQVDNDNGYAGIAYGMPPGGTPANEVFVLGTIGFKALAETTGTVVTFHTAGIRTTKAVRGFTDVTGTHVDGNVTVSPIDTTAPVVTITSPEDDLITSNPSQVVTGTISDTAITAATLIVSGTPRTIAITDGSFSQTVILVEGLNTISVSATDADGNVVTSQITVSMISALPGDTNGDSGSVDTNALTDLPKDEETPTSPQAKPINWPALWGVIGGVVVVALLIFFLVRRRPY